MSSVAPARILIRSRSSSSSLSVHQHQPKMRTIRIGFIILTVIYLAVTYFLIQILFSKNSFIRNSSYLNPWIEEHVSVRFPELYREFEYLRIENASVYRKFVSQYWNQSWAEWGYMVPDQWFTSESVPQYGGNSEIPTCESSEKNQCSAEDLNSVTLPVLDAYNRKIFKEKRNDTNGICYSSFSLPSGARKYSRLATAELDGVNFSDLLNNGSSIVGKFVSKRLSRDGDVSLLMIPNGFVTTNGTVMDCERRIVNGKVCSPFVLQNQTKIEKVDPKIYPRLVIVDQTHAEQYFHFMIETFPKVSVIPESLFNDESTYFYFQIDLPFVRNMLSVFGKIPMDRVVFGQSGIAHQAEMLYYIQPSICHIGRHFNVNKLRYQIYNTQKLNPVKDPAVQDSIVFIDRGADADRSIANQEDLLALIQTRYPKEKLVIFHPNATFAETVEIFHKAKMIIGAHGAGLSNMIFSLAGTPVLEFMISKQLLCYHDLAAALGMHYSTFQPGDAHWKTKGMHVDLITFTKVMDQMILYANSPMAYQFPWSKW